MEEPRLDDRVAELAALRRLAVTVAEDASPAEVFAKVAEETGRLFGGVDGGLLRDERDGTACVVACWGVATTACFPVGSRYSLGGEGITGTVLGKGRPGRVTYADVPGEIGERARAYGIRAAVACPIVVGGEIWGALIVATTRDEPFPPETEQRIQQFAHLVATALGAADARAEVERLAEEQAALRRVATLVAQGAPASAVFSAVCDEVAKLFDTNHALVARFEAETGVTVVVGAGSGVRGPWIGARIVNAESPVITAVARTRRAARGPVGRAPIAVANYIREDGRVWVKTVAAPILVDGRLWGVVGFSTGSEPPPDTEMRLESFTELLATAVANTESRAEVERLADEQAALRRVATLVAQGVPPTAVFSAVCDEVGRLFRTHMAVVSKYERPGPVIVVVGAASGIERTVIGSRWEPVDSMATTKVLRTGRSARGDGPWLDPSVEGAAADALRRFRGGGSVASPIVVGDRLWGTVAAEPNERLPGDAEERLERFAELVSLAIANADSRAELAASRARVIAAADDARCQIERDLHDGAQQRLVTLALALGRLERRAPSEFREEIGRVAEGLNAAVAELREISRGIHPAVLSEGGLPPALKALGRRSPVSVKLELGAPPRLPDQIEVAAYYVVAEALTNAARHAHATQVAVSLRVDNNSLGLSIRDDGIGGADATRGSGLTGLRDRVEALSGTITVESPQGSGTRIDVELPAFPG
jgi:signal transduction histidine kinase